MDLIKVAEEAFATGKTHPEFGPGDTITVAYRIKEGTKSVSSSIAALLSASRVRVPRNASPFAK